MTDARFSVKISGSTRDRLLDIADKRETFDQVIFRLIAVHDAVLGIKPIIEGMEAYQKWAKQKQGELKSIT